MFEYILKALNLDDRKLQRLLYSPYLVIPLCLGAALWAPYKIIPESLQKQMPAWVPLVVCVVLFLLLISFWLYNRVLPRFGKRTIGIAIAILPETKEDDTRLKGDFIQRLKDDFSTQYSGGFFSIREIPYWQVDVDLNNKWQEEILQKTKATLLLCGSLKKRKVDSGDAYVIPLRARVKHPRAPEGDLKYFRSEFQYNFGRTFQIGENNELQGFEVTADTIYGSTLYIVALAEALRNDYKRAYEILKKIYDNIDTQRFGLTKSLLIDRIKSILPEFAMNYVGLIYQAICKSGDSRLWGTIVPVLDYTKGIAPDNYRVHLLKSIQLFSMERDVVGALNELNLAPAQNDPCWQFSKAFLLAYQGDLVAANECYKKATRLPPDVSAMAQTEEFIGKVLVSEPEKIQLWFCLGTVNLFMKGDKVLAYADFEKFLEASGSTHYSEMVREVKKWIKNRELGC